MNDNVCSYHLFERGDEFNILLESGKLLNVFAVDMWQACERSDLNYIRRNQDKLRTTTYNAMQDAGANDGQNIGRVLLPSSFVGSPRWWQKQYLDVMTYVTHGGIPDLFNTFTCNPRWPAIEEKLEFRHGGYKKRACWREDVIARKFDVVCHKYKRLTKKLKVSNYVKCYIL